jgi:DNA helicase II / ATP-dependent DNA helicase PcrA
VDFETRYKKLNDRQKEAVDTIDGPLMVVAGPGTGKTELLSMRAANILRKTDTLPENILCLTFTESGATAMRRRLSEIIGPAAYKVAIHTFHSFGSEIINQNGEYFYHGADFRPASELSAYELLRDIFDSLDLSNPLASTMNGEYTHLADTLTTIGELKKSGLTSDELLEVLDANDAALDASEAHLAEIFSERISTKTVAKLMPVATKLASMEVPRLPPGIAPLANVLALSLAHAVDTAEDEESTKPITAWKNLYMEKDAEGSFVFKDRKRSKKLRAVSYLYYQYLLKMQESELYDFDDMVLRVVHAMEVFPELRFNLQERYLYIMVDEFQDTNMAQMRILHNLTSGPFGEEPNIMAVGDDDQAIYSFQGAEVGNILSFKDRYESLKIVTLTDNYRSSAPILEKSRAVITLGEGRLEHYVEEIDKTLTAHKPPTGSHVKLLEYGRIEDERRGLARRIREQINSGVAPAHIAVLARRHHELVKLLPYLFDEGISVNYERRDNVLEAEIVEQLTLLAEIVAHIADNHIGEADALLPQLLAHPAWNIDTSALWNLSLSAYRHNGGWLEEMATQPDFKLLHTWLISTARLALTEPAEAVIDRLVGKQDDEQPNEEFLSPIYNYFFSDERRQADTEQYLTFLEALRTIRAKLREYRPDRSVYLHDFIEFVKLHKRIGSAITSVRVRSDLSEGAVQLMTAHKSKGLEFEHVHIVGAIDISWGERVRSRSRLIGYPENLQLRPSGETMDERLRLFFVAMTRAKRTLHISYSTSDENGRATMRASFLTGNGWESEEVSDTSDVQKLAEQLETEWYRPLINVSENDMKRLLQPVLESYKLSATHLNNFLDVSRGGPQNFLISNLLRFPQAMTPQAAYGSAVHRTLQRAHDHLKTTDKPKPLEDILQDYEKHLSGMRLSDHDLTHYLQHGQEVLQAFMIAKAESFTATQRTELSFANQQSMVGSAVLTGALDLIDVDDTTKSITVTDYKTGKSSKDWHGREDWEKVKLHKYRQQLLFYKLLVEHSRDFSTYTVDKGILQFVEPDTTGKILALEMEYNSEELERFARLIEAVYTHIVTLDLPNAADYTADYAGMLQFERDLLGE